MTTIKTTVYLLSDDHIDSIAFIIDAISEYALNHIDKKDTAKLIISQIIHCKDNFSEPYRNRK